MARKKIRNSILIPVIKKDYLFDVIGNKQQATSNKQQATSNKQQA